jgi:hypothetical protein
MFRNASLPLRIAAVISLLFAVGHTLGGLTSSWSPVGETAVLASMRAFHFDVAGANRSYFDFYRGFGFLLTVYLVTQAILLWQVGAIARSQASLARPLIWIFLAASIPIGILTWAYLFPTPVYFDAALTACLAWAAFV